MTKTLGKLQVKKADDSNGAVDLSSGCKMSIIPCLVLHIVPENGDDVNTPPRNNSRHL